MTLELFINLKKGISSKVREMIDADRSLIFVEDSYGATPLIYATENNDVNLMAYLLEKGACPFKVDMMGRSCLSLVFASTDTAIKDVVMESLKNGRRMNFDKLPDFGLDKLKLWEVSHDFFGKEYAYKEDGKTRSFLGSFNITLNISVLTNTRNPMTLAIPRTDEAIFSQFVVIDLFPAPDNIKKEMEDDQQYQIKKRSLNEEAKRSWFKDDVLNSRRIHFAKAGITYIANYDISFIKEALIELQERNTDR